jgi:DNA-binding NtrC family response regulator
VHRFGPLMLNQRLKAVLQPHVRARKEDIPLLAEYFIHRYAGKMAKKISSISRERVWKCSNPTRAHCFRVGL